MMFPYERVVQWATGPVSAGIGLLATDVMHQNISKNSAVAVSTFVLSSAATYLAHHKWLDNLAKWWDKQNPVVREDAQKVGQDVAPDIEAEATKMFNELTGQQAAAEKIQNQPGDPNPQHGLTPDAPAAVHSQAPAPSVPPQG